MSKTLDTEKGCFDSQERDINSEESLPIKVPEHYKPLSHCRILPRDSVEGSHTWCNIVFSNITKEWKQIANIIYATNRT